MCESVRGMGNPKSKIARGTRGTRHDPPTNGFKPGSSGNPAGGIRRGMSHAEILRTVDDWTAQQVVEFLDAMGARLDNPIRKKFDDMPRNVALRHLFVLASRAAAMNDPTPAWFDSLANRSDGKVADKIDGAVAFTFRGVRDEDLPKDG